MLTSVVKISGCRILSTSAYIVHFCASPVDLSHRFDYAATKTGSIIIPCSGLDSVPTDLVVYLANKTLKATIGPDTAIENSTSAWDVAQGSLSGGTLGTTFAAIEEVPRAKLIESTKDYRLSPGQSTFNIEH
jgi:short subunit dehydrogenase-like uncharacterized protein